MSTHKQTNDKGEELEAQLHVDESNSFLSVLMVRHKEGNEHATLCALSCGDHYAQFVRFLDGTLLASSGIDCASESYSEKWKHEVTQLAYLIENRGFDYRAFVDFATD